MALGTPTLVSSAGASATNVTTGAFTPSANSLLIALCGGRSSSAVVPTISDSLGGTWTAVHADSDQDQGVTVGNVFYREIGASPASMTVTVTSTGATQTGVHIIEITGNYGIDFSNFQFGLNTAGDPALTMGSFTAGSLCLGLYVNSAGGAVTSPSGHTELLDSAIATNLRMVSSHDTTSPGTSMSWTGTGGDTIGYGLEIKEAAGGSTYNEGVVEAATAAETTNTALVGVGALAEILAAAETTNRSIVAVGDLAETLNAVAAQSTLGVFESITAEILTVAETQTGTGIFSKSLAETITVVDAQTGGLVQTGAVAEVLTGVETQATVLVAVGALAETLAVAETQAGLGVFGKSQAETLAVVDLSSSVLAVFNTVRARAMIVG